jgi:hypothetical protein
MNVIVSPPISLTLNSGYLVTEGDGIGTVAFRIDEQTIYLILTTSSYSYDSSFSVGCRVKLNEQYSSLDIDSEGTLQSIIINFTDDMGDVYFDIIYPDNEFNSQNMIKTQSGTVSVLVRVSLRLLTRI